jgi:mono/diheme cytochrome c family protein
MVKAGTMKLCIAAVAVLACAAQPAFAGNAQDIGADAMNRMDAFPFRGGEAIFTNVCQGCHMADAKGAAGAAAYPALARDSKLDVAAYPVAVVVHGQKSMPPLGALLDDQQIADVVNYVRSHFGNSYKDKVTPENVKAQR